MKCPRCGQKMETKLFFVENREPILAVCPNKDCGVFYCGDRSFFLDNYKVACSIGFYKPEEKSTVFDDVIVRLNSQLNQIGGVAAGVYRKMILD